MESDQRSHPAHEPLPQQKLRHELGGDVYDGWRQGGFYRQQVAGVGRICQDRAVGGVAHLVHRRHQIGAVG